ncbi:MAG: MogA/MoaB family molybdenum cofactor biosynthesis protein [Phycisphaerales bacterium]|nr:MogA/MoaB family molybdenum cofactor biosynthesis protein [Phycisphaerales bacterium]
MESTHEHKQAARAGDTRVVRCAVLTVSDTRTPETDRGGDTVVSHVEQAGHSVVKRAIVHDDAGPIRDQLIEWIADVDIQVILTTGGTGIAGRDTTIDVVRRLLTIELEGFGELFRMLSFKEIGASAMLSRAVGGLVCGDGSGGGGSGGGGRGGDTFIFSMPGSVNAVKTAMTGLIAPELSHLVWERRR